VTDAAVITNSTTTSEHLPVRNDNKSSQSNLGGAASPSLTPENVAYPPVCNAHCRRVQSLSRRYATSKPQCHILPLYITLRFPIPRPQNLSFPVRDPHPPKKIILGLTRPTAPNGIIGVHPLNFYCYNYT